MGRSLVDSTLMGVIYAFCDAVAAPYGCIDFHQDLNGQNLNGQDLVG
jgi:hypothetical protein